jgi:1,4-dihydroxy-2-naphthoate octaprenyltransferase
MLRLSTIQLLRFHFSFFLMPLYWFALSQVSHINKSHALLIFFILHVLVYPSSNGYNSYMDRDTSSIGGVKNPLQPTKELFYVTILLDILALTMSFFISAYFFGGVLLFIAASHAYSFRGIRLKKYPIIGFLTVIIFQGALVFLIVIQGCSQDGITSYPTAAIIGSALLIGALYPLTQIYQHQQDAVDGVKSISAMLGYRGTFIFSSTMFIFSTTSLAWYFVNNMELNLFLLLQVCLLPALIYFFWWFRKVLSNVKNANFENSMKMNLIGSICSNIGFISVLIINKC